MDVLTEYREAACEAARRGAAVLLEWRQRFQVREKGRADLVTEADLGSQQAIHDYLQQRFPDHAFLGEEGEGERQIPGPDAPPTWIVDPLDGTTNYVHDYPAYAVSIGLQVKGALVVGVVYDPTREELFSAASGQGTYVNDRRLQTSNTDQLGDAMLATGFPPDMRGKEFIFAYWQHFSLHARSLRRTGSTALNLAYVAAGRFDGFWSFDNFVWDVAGGTVLVREAGGIVTNVDGSPYNPYTPDALACGPQLHPIMLEAIQSAG